MYCLKCGTKIVSGDKFCPTCGARLDSGAPDKELGAKGGAGDRFGKDVYDDLATQIIRQRQQGTQGGTAPEPQASQAQQRSPQDYVQRYTANYTGTGTKRKKNQHTTIIILLVVAILLAVLALVVFTRGGSRSENPRQPASASQSAEAGASESIEEPSAAEPEQEPDTPADTSVPPDAEIAGHQASGSAEQPPAPEESPIEQTDYILPGVDTGYIDRAVLEAMTDEELRLARNEIYARHGRKFDSPELDQYFRSTSWYVPTYSPEEFDALGDSVLNQYEIANRDLIVEIEASRKS